MHGIAGSDGAPTAAAFVLALDVCRLRGRVPCGLRVPVPVSPLSESWLCFRQFDIFMWVQTFWLWPRWAQRGSRACYFSVASEFFHDRDRHVFVIESCSCSFGVNTCDRLIVAAATAAYTVPSYSKACLELTAGSEINCSPSYSKVLSERERYSKLVSGLSERAPPNYSLQK